MKLGEKNRTIVYLTLLLLLITPPPAESFIFTAIMTAVSFAYQAYNIINDAHDTYKKFAPQTTLDDVLDQAKQVEKKVDQIGAQLSNQISQAVDSIVTQVDDKAHLREGLTTLAQGIRRIDNLYRLFELYTTKKISLNNQTLQDYIQQVTSVGALSPKDILSEIHDLIIPSMGFRRSLISYLQKDSPKNDTYTCGSGVPAQGNFYQIFRLIMVNEIRTFTMLTFAYSLNQVYKCESYKGEIKLAEYDLRERALEYYKVFLDVAEEIPNSIHTCDPSGGWERGHTFYEFERFQTEFLTSERVFFQMEDCDRKCEDLLEPSYVGSCEPSFGCNEDTTCQGNIYGCIGIKNQRATVCELQYGSKRYQWFSNGDDRVWGNDKDGCEGNEIVLEKEDHCEVCSCTCVEDNYNSQSLRAVSLREQLTDIADNKVVTGVKFILKNNMIHIQLQQGVVLTEGRISLSSQNWVPLEWIDYDPSTTRNEQMLSYYAVLKNGDYLDMEELKDFIAFNWKSHRINLDTLAVPPGYVVTGARFNTPVKDPSEINPLQLEIHASPFDYDSGKIVVTNDNPSIWLTPEDMVGVSKEYDRERMPIEFVKPENPEYEKGTYTPKSPPNSYVDLRQTDVEEDGGQGTIPFLDAQEVVGKPAFAAGGIGLYLKTITPGGGGFIGFRLLGLESMKNIPMQALNQLDKYSEGVTAFKGCNDDL